MGGLFFLWIAYLFQLRSMFSCYSAVSKVTNVKFKELSMLPDALISCSNLLICCGSSIYQLVSHSYDNFSTILPQFAFASFGIAAIGARCLFNLGYNIFWRNYPIDPLLIEEDIKLQRQDRNTVDSCLSIFGLASLIYSLYHHHGYQITGTIVTVSLTLVEFICLKKNQTTSNSSTISTYTGTIAEVINGWITTLWIFSFGFFGWAVGNDYARLAIVPCIVSMSMYPPEGFYNVWSIKNCLMDYMMIIYIILMSEALCQTPVE